MNYPPVHNPVKDTVQYVGAALTNESAQKVHAYFKQILTAFDKYLDEYEVDDTSISILKPDSYHLTIMDSEVPFEIFRDAYQVPDDVESVDITLHENYIVLEVFSDKTEDLNETMQYLGAEQNWDYFPYIALARIDNMTDEIEEQMWDMIDFASDEVVQDMKINLDHIFTLEDSVMDPEKIESNYL